MAAKTTKKATRKTRRAQPAAGPSENLARFLCRLPRDQWADVRRYAETHKVTYMQAMRDLVAAGLQKAARAA